MEIDDNGVWEGETEEKHENHAQRHSMNEKTTDGNGVSAERLVEVPFEKKVNASIVCDVRSMFLIALALVWLTSLVR